jgi:hypothetical protein
LITPARTVNQNSKDVLVSHLSSYNIPLFILERVAGKCNSELVRKGKIVTILNSMNEPALELLHKIFVECEDDEEGEFSDYRFGVFVSSRVHSRLMFDQTLKGGSGASYSVKVAVYGDQGLLAIGENKSRGEKVSADELAHFNKMVKDLSRSKDGQNLQYAFYGSSVGYDKNFNKAFVGSRKVKAASNVPKTITLVEFRDKNTNQILSSLF